MDHSLDPAVQDVIDLIDAAIDDLEVENRRDWEYWRNIQHPQEEGCDGELELIDINHKTIDGIISVTYRLQK
jgi:hypothetical protein